MSLVTSTLVSKRPEKPDSLTNLVAIDRASFTVAFPNRSYWLMRWRGAWQRSYCQRDRIPWKNETEEPQVRFSCGLARPQAVNIPERINDRTIVPIDRYDERRWRTRNFKIWPTTRFGNVVNH
jgi:hypothetical protein